MAQTQTLAVYLIVVVSLLCSTFGKFYFIDIPKAFNDASSYCKHNGGKLMVIDTQSIGGYFNRVSASSIVTAASPTNDATNVWVEDALGGSCRVINTATFGGSYNPCTTLNTFLCDIVITNHAPYIQPEEYLPWNDASTYCKENVGSELATISNQEDMDNLKNILYVDLEYNSYGVFWIGLHSDHWATPTTRQWFWDDGDNELSCDSKTGTLCTTFWLSGQPSGQYEDTAENAQNCGSYSKNVNGINDVECGREQQFICNAPVTFTDPATKVDSEWIIAGLLSLILLCNVYIISLFCYNIKNKNESNIYNSVKKVDSESESQRI